MKSLIRLSLLTVARTALFFIALAWIVGQAWYLRLAVPVGTLQLCEQGWLWERQTNRRWRMTSGAVKKDSDPLQVMNDWRFHSAKNSNDRDGFLTSQLCKKSTVHEFAGVVTTDTPFFGSWSIAFRHWLVTIIFLVVYATVHLAFRPRPQHSLAAGDAPDSVPTG